MSYGIRIEGDYGQLLIDDTLPVFQIVEEGYLDGAVVTFKHVYPKTPLVVIFPPTGRACWISSGGVYPKGFSAFCYEGFPYSRNHGPIVFPRPAYGARYAVIADYIPESDEAWGVRAWAADGRLVYDSGYPLGYFRGFGSSMNHWYNFQTRNDNKLEAYIFVHRIPMPDETCGVVLNTLPFSGDTYPTHNAGLRAPNQGYFGWRDGGRENFGVGVQGPPGFSSGSQSVGDIAMYMQSVLFVSK